MEVRRTVFLVLVLAGIFTARGTEAGIWNLNAGLATQRQTDRDSNKRTDSLDILGSASYLSPEWKFVLDLHLSWDTQEKSIDKDIWNRKGDFLRPLEALVYSSSDGKWFCGLEVLDSWTPGEGYLVRELTGRAEVDYVLPGFRLRLRSEKLRVEIGTDRPVDPTVQAAAVSWEPWEDVQVVVEGAVDPEAPESFTGTFKRGRPEAEETRRITGSAMGVLFPLKDGDILDIKAGGHAAKLGDEGSGLGWEVRVSLDLSRYYLNRLSFKGGSVECAGGYVPAWFDAVYPVQRWGLSGLPPLASNPLDGGASDNRLEILDVMYELGNAFRISIGADRFTDDSLKRARFLLDLKESGGRGLQAAIWSRADGPDEELFTVDENFYARVSALYAFVPHMLVKVTYDRSWAFREDKGGLVPISSILLGVMYNISL